MYRTNLRDVPTVEGLKDAHARSGPQPAQLDQPVALTFADVGDHG